MLSARRCWVVSQLRIYKSWGFYLTDSGFYCFLRPQKNHPALLIQYNLSEIHCHRLRLPFNKKLLPPDTTHTAWPQAYTMAPPREALYFPTSQSQQIDPYMPSPSPQSQSPSKPFVTLTFATSLDSQLALAPGVQTALSGPESKAMTHYLRSKHDAILIGVGTAIADDPSLNCRIEGVGGYGGEGLDGQPRPVVLDPQGRWSISEESKVVKLAKEGRGKAPWVITKVDVGGEKKRLLESVGGRFLRYEDSLGRVSTPLPTSMSWHEMFGLLFHEGITSVMIEGGGVVINDLLAAENLKLVNSVVITIAPTWLGRGGVQVCPEQRQELGRSLPAGRLKDVKWMPLGEDVVLCGRPQ